MRFGYKKILKFGENNTLRFGDEDIFRYRISATSYGYRISAITCFITPPFSLSRNTENIKPADGILETSGDTCQALEITLCENHWIFEDLEAT